MTSRERVAAALNFERPDRLPVSDALWDGLQDEWIAEGMPAGVSPADHFDWDISNMFLDVSPRFPTRILARSGGMITYEDRFGYTVKKSDGRSGTLDFLSHKTRTQDDWETLVKPRMTMDTSPEQARIDSASYFCHLDRYPSWEEAREKYDVIHAQDRFLLFTAYGPWEATWRHHGMEDLLMDALAEPEWCADMFESYTTLLLDVLQACVARGMVPDGIYIPEDMGFKTGLMIGPSTWDRLLRPCYERIRDFTKLQGIQFWMHTDGHVYDLIERFLEMGVTALNPLECAAGMDIAELRKRFGNRMTCYGNISAGNLLGPWENLEAELERKIPFAAQGGFIMHSDHSIPFGVTCYQYKKARQRAQEIFEKTAS